MKRYKFIKTLMMVTLTAVLAGCGANQENVNDDSSANAIAELENKAAEALANEEENIENEKEVISDTQPEKTETDVEIEGLPVKYSLIDEGMAPGVRNQEQSGICWAFSSNTMVEANVIKKGYESADVVDFSEGYVVHQIFDFEEDMPEDFTTDSSLFVCNKNTGITFPYKIGGQALNVLFKYGAGSGPIDESEAPLDLKRTEFVNSVTAIDEAFMDGTLNDQMGKYIVTNINILDVANTESIKENILEYGSVGINMNLFYTGNGKLYENPEKAPAFGNHVTTIIGWDDEYSKDNFSVDKPKRDGAWLIQDSTRLAGTDGYFWMSYENLLYGAYSVDVEKRDNYGQVLVYDDLGPMEYIKSKEDSTVVANVFEVKEDNALTAVCVDTFSILQEVEISVYKNPEIDQPDSGELVWETVVCPEYKGYHVVDIDKDIALSEGDTFSVVMRYKNTVAANYGMVGVEGDGVKINAMNDNEDIKLVLNAKKGQSYGFVGGNWYDMTSEQAAEAFGFDGTINNVCIRALLAH